MFYSIWTFENHPTIGIKRDTITKPCSGRCFEFPLPWRRPLKDIQKSSCSSYGCLFLLYNKWVAVPFNYKTRGSQSQPYERWIRINLLPIMVTDRIMEKKNVQLRQAAPASDFSIIGFFPIRVQNIPEVIRSCFFPIILGGGHYFHN